MIVVSFLWATLAAIQGGELSVAVPPELLAAQAARQFANGFVQWTYQSLTESDGKTGSRPRFSFAFTDDQTLSRVEHDDRTNSELWYQGRYWRNYGAMSADVTAGGPANSIDARTLGTGPAGMGESMGLASLPALDSDAGTLFDVTSSGGLRVVTRYVDHGDGPVPRMRQWIDPRRGWNVVRVEQLGDDGEVVLRSVTELRQYGEVWFPKTVTVYNPAKSSEPVSILTVLEARFNSPSLPSSFTPNDIGVEVGTNVWVQTESGERQLQGWDGAGLLEWGVLAGRVNRGELAYGPNYLRQRSASARKAAVMLSWLNRLYPDRESQDVNLYVARTDPGRWEEYVRRFIEHYTLDDAQRQKAWMIYKSCVDQVDGLLARRDRKDVEAAQRAQEAVDVVPDTADPSAEIERLGETEARLLRPVVDVFEKQLKPRLERLLTRQQRARGPFDG